MKDEHRWKRGHNHPRRTNLDTRDDLNQHRFPAPERPERPERQERQGRKTFTRGEISRLLNSIHFFLECVYIKVDEKCFRLVVLNKNRTEMDKAFRTLRGAKIAFCKLFKPMAWGENVLPQWSTFYYPESNWINEKNKIVLRSRVSSPLNGENSEGEKGE